jgi:hypothetical protein
VQQWALENETRLDYDNEREHNSNTLLDVLNLLNSGEQDTLLTEQQCRIIVHSAFITIPPAELPSASELISSGRLERIVTLSLRNSIFK